MCSLMGAMIGLNVVQGIQRDRAIKNEARAQEAVYKSQARANEQNARIASRQQEQIAHQYAQQQEELNSRRRLIAGANRASAGASGYETAGSVDDVENANTDQYILDSMNLLGNQRNDVRDAYIQQVNYENAARADRASAKNIRASTSGLRLANFISTVAGAYRAYRTYAPVQSNVPKMMTNAKTGFSGSLMSGNLKYDSPTMNSWANHTPLYGFQYQNYDVTGAPVMPTFGLPKTRSFIGNNNFTMLDTNKLFRVNDPDSIFKRNG